VEHFVSRIQMDNHIMTAKSQRKLMQEVFGRDLAYNGKGPLPISSKFYSFTATGRCSY